MDWHCVIQYAARAQSIILGRQGSVSLHLSMAGYPGNATFLDARVQQTWDPEDLSSRKILPKGLRTPDPESSQPSYPSLWLLLNPLSSTLSLAFPVPAGGPSMPSLPTLGCTPDSPTLMEQPHPSSLYGSVVPLIREATVMWLHLWSMIPFPPVIFITGNIKTSPSLINF